MKIFITGKNGFIAQHLIKRCIDDSHIVESSSHTDNLLLKLNNFSPDIICHLGAELNNDDKMIESNILLTHNILEYCRYNKIKKLIIFGSSSEYGRKTIPIKENDVLEPCTMYESTKACASLLARAYAYTYNIQTTIIRPFTVYGQGEKSHKLIPLIFSQKINYLNNSMHDYIYIKDFIDATIIIMNYNEKDIYNIINIGSGIQTSNFDLIKKCESIINSKLSFIVTSNGKKYDSMNWVCNTELLNTKYNFNAKYSLDDGLKEYYSNYIINGSNNSIIV